jgi:hypothetical protein
MKATAKLKETIHDEKGSQLNEWCLRDFRGGNNFQYIRTKKC